MTIAASQNYLKAIRELRGANGRVTTCVLARHLHIAPASATNMMWWLAANGLVDYAPYRSAALTPAGELEAGEVSHRHEVIEQYLICTLGFDQTQAHVKAEQLDPVVSSDLVIKLATAHSMRFSMSGGSTGVT